VLEQENCSTAKCSSADGCINQSHKVVKSADRGTALQDHEQLVATLHERFASRMRELRSHAVAEEVCHETLLRVMQAIRENKLVTEAALPGFVSGTARNVILEFRRKESRTAPLGDREFAAPPREGLVDASVRKAMQQVFDRLKPRERDVLQLFYLEELTKEEIGARLDLDPERVRLVKSRALKSFREFYDRLTRKNPKSLLQKDGEGH